MQKIKAIKKQAPITTADLFDLIYNRLCDKNLIPTNFLDYALSTNHPEAIKTYEFDLKNNLSFGSNEGIYLDLWIDIWQNGENHLVAQLGTLKTLHETSEAMRMMASILAEFIIEENTYVNANLDDFSWVGADLHIINEDGSVGWGYSFQSLTAAEKKKDELINKYHRIIIRDNATRAITMYTN